MGTSFGKSVEQAYADQLFDAYTAHGGNCFDAALVYFDAEQTLGRWLRARGNRHEVIIHAKGAHHETLCPPGCPFEYHRARVTPADIEADLTETLARLQTDYVDIFTLHRDDPDQPVGPIIDCLARLRSQGRIRAYGASNWTIDRLEAAHQYALSKQVPPFALSSPNLALAYSNEPSWPNCVTACDAASRSYYAREKTPLFAWSCLALGFFSGQYEPLAKTSPETFARLMSNRWSSDVVRVYYSERNFERLARAQKLAQAKGVTATQIALAWVLHLPLNLYAVAGPRSQEEIESLFAAFEIELSPEEIAWLNLEN